MRVIHTAGYTLVSLAPEKPSYSNANDAAIPIAEAKSADPEAIEPTQLRVGHHPRIDFSEGIPVHPRVATRDRFGEVEALLAKVTPWSGNVAAAGFVIDFLGILTDGGFLWNTTGSFEAHFATTELPSVDSWGEGWCEIADSFYSASEASGEYVAISLGALYDPQLCVIPVVL